MNNWKSNFTDQILERGRDYYEYGHVRIKNASPKRVEAQVDGSRNYNVLITLKNSKITSMFCDCPYFEGYDNCKHLAATLYYLENHPDLTKPVKYKDLLDSFTKEELVEFLDGELKDNPDLANKLRLFKNDDVDEDYYVHRLKISLANTRDILSFMDMEIQDLIKAEQFTVMFRLLTIIIDHVNEELEWGYMPSYENIIYKIDYVISKVRDTASIDDITEFLMYAIKSSDDYFIDEELTDCMSRNGDMQRLIDTWEER